ncbi:hypothetical protein IEA_05642 [Bacillus toyonensis]|nr:hypothetical protein IEA_05642 [Bacillus toyonensis]
MVVAYINGKYYLADDDRAFGWHGVEITKEAYEALKECKISHWFEKSLGEHADILNEEEERNESNNQRKNVNTN